MTISGIFFSFVSRIVGFKNACGAGMFETRKKQMDLKENEKW